jgi:trehalose 6-phosphate phosphatase
MFIGDDVGDLPAFDELDRLQSAGRETLKVAVGGAEAPDQLLHRADVVVAGPGQVVDLLARLAGP